MVIVKYEDLSEAFGFVSFGAPMEHHAYLSLYTGPFYWLSEVGAIEEELEIPHKNDLHLGRELALRFVDEHLPRRYAAAESVFRRRGAYGRFKELLARDGCLEKWYAYENEATKRALQEWCEVNQIRLGGTEPTA